MGFQPRMAREELIWVMGTNPASGCESAGGRGGAGWKNLAGKGQMGQREHPGAGQVGGTSGAGSSGGLWGVG